MRSRWRNTRFPQDACGPRACGLLAWDTNRERKSARRVLLVGLGLVHDVNQASGVRDALAQQVVERHDPYHLALARDDRNPAHAMAAHTCDDLRRVFGLVRDD